ncbi:tyrosine-protein kinase receptor UFO isoform X2 [Danio rerio]|uniref:Tyrosine-protein kinase receptor UFO isoform X2 n=3 Tax=Danio rerio TaxID=7955 RepID=A0AC58HED2_DANRE|nr:tyrosine-protein kinase receptor UFO [Danio rerio]|eukprot:XP_017206598.2 tyrosine-protein kinase receptor UFO [Danio rerio]
MMMKKMMKMQSSGGPAALSGCCVRWRVRCSGLCALLIAAVLRCCSANSDLRFVESPGNVTSSLGKPVSLQCVLQAFGLDEEPLDLLWLRDGRTLEYADTNQIQMLEEDHSWTVISKLTIEEVQLLDMGAYRCVLYSGEEETSSAEGYIQLEGLPHFSVEPQDRSAVANEPLSLRCEAHGPPEPVRVIWLQDGAPLNELDDPVALSPSTLNISGLNKSSSFSCEAHNRKGVASSATGVVTVLPSPPSAITADEISNSSIRLSWHSGFGGVYPISHCSVQVQDSSGSLVQDQQVSGVVGVCVISDLQAFSQYEVRLQCRSSQGPSSWSQWRPVSTAEGVPESAPENVTAVLNGTEVILSWSEVSGRINGRLQGYMLEYSTPNEEQAVLDVGLDTEQSVNLSEPLSNISFRVCAYTGAGPGPWTAQHTLTLIPTETGQSRGSPTPAVFSWHWWYVVMAVAVAVALAVLLAVYGTRLRRKETRFGEAFEPMMESGELVVRYRARRTYSRRTTEATLNSLGISDELKQKLQDVMVDRHRLTLGKTLGEGEFGSVMEGSLSQEDSVLKVAVKTMKIAICTRTEMEDFLREAACMKEFDHQNVMRLLGVCLQTVESEGYPSPVVILPYMKHGDLHSYLLYSRLGDSPVYLPAQMLVKFMTDIARGMEYLCRKNFIHRDLAARNCMLNENMNVCVADFGLSKKIYNGDYYRQGRISKMPVKWIAIESLADRVYTTKSDVWSFGVTMWEIATRGQTPYPGVENSEIYDYLRQGNRLKQPPDCLDSIYSLMFSCWLLSPKDRPSFEMLRCELEKVLEDLPSQDPEEILYVNMEESSGELGATGGLPCALGALKGSVATVEVHPPSRYVLCPQLENQRLLSAHSTDSLELPGLGADLDPEPEPQPSSCSTPLPERQSPELEPHSRRAAWH